jgi:hypothetical protein
MSHYVPLGASALRSVRQAPSGDSNIKIYRTPLVDIENMSHRPDAASRTVPLGWRLIGISGLQRYAVVRPFFLVRAYFSLPDKLRRAAESEAISIKQRVVLSAAIPLPLPIL